jgi:hypothetical protein
MFRARSAKGMKKLFEALSFEAVSNTPAILSVKAV